MNPVITERKLPTKFRKFGHLFTVLRREGDAVLVSRSDGGRLLGYEVAIVQHNPEVEINGRVIEANEGMPGTSQWGSAGWSYLARDREGAERKFQSLTQ